jgi:hypothetical protein
MYLAIDPYLSQYSQKRKGCGAHRKSNHKLARAALRFARLLKRTGAVYGS